MEEEEEFTQPPWPEKYKKRWIHTFLDDNLAEIWVWMVEACQSLEFNGVGGEEEEEMKVAEGRGGEVRF